ncbi:MAG: hypothetical protein Q4D06_08480 [Coriobacteriia bacterium]|nr:hypothetical protein [Coriobacteriia bacterium]
MLEKFDPRRSICYYLASHPERNAYADIRPLVREIFSRTPNGMGTVKWPWRCAGKRCEARYRKGRDLWYCGYTPQLSTAVWTGADPERSMWSASWCRDMWRIFMEKALDGVEPQDFTKAEEPEYESPFNDKAKEKYGTEDDDEDGEGRRGNGGGDGETAADGQDEGNQGGEGGQTGETGNTGNTGEGGETGGGEGAGEAGGNGDNGGETPAGGGAEAPAGGYGDEGGGA